MKSSTDIFEWISAKHKRIDSHMKRTKKKKSIFIVRWIERERKKSLTYTVSESGVSSRSSSHKIDSGFIDTLRRQRLIASLYTRNVWRCYRCCFKMMFRFSLCTPWGMSDTTQIHWYFATNNDKNVYYFALVFVDEYSCETRRSLLIM